MIDYYMNCALIAESGLPASFCAAKAFRESGEKRPDLLGRLDKGVKSVHLLGIHMGS
jgi:hypothetical protein